jgi:ACR3 family arsenite transporter
LFGTGALWHPRGALTARNASKNQLQPRLRLLLIQEDMKNKRLNFIDRYLTLWIFLAMGIGVAIGNIFPSIDQVINRYSVGTTNIPLALGLIIMMIPPLVKVDFKKIPVVFQNRKLLRLSLLITWIVGPFLMFILATTFLSNEPEYLTGLIIIGLAPCIAMVIVWNELAGGSRELAAGLVGINSLLQVFFFSAYAYFYLEVMLPLFGFDAIQIDLSFWEVAKTVGVYLGLPFGIAVSLRYWITKNKGETYLNTQFIPKISPFTLYALLFTIVVMFSLKGQLIAELPLDVLKIAPPLVIFFIVMFFLMFLMAKWSGASYPETATVAFTASGNNFELAIAVAIGVFGLNSGQAFAGVIGPLVEVPALILLVKASLYLKKYF